MPDHSGDRDPTPDTAPEAAELRRQRVEELRQERGRRTSEEAPHSGRAVRWKPPAEMATPGSRKTLLRLLVLAAALAGGYLGLRTLTRTAFASKLVPLNASVP